MIGAVLFDVDGTLIDSNDLHAVAWREAFLHFGMDFPLDEIRQQIGKGGDNLIPTLLPDVTDERQEEIDTLRGELFKRDYLPRVVPFPFVRELFERLKADGRKIVLASSAKGAEVDFHLGLIGAADLVDATTSKDDVEHSKPCPDIFEAALGQVSPLTAADVVVIGDSPFDILAAKKLGIRTIAFRSGGFADEVLEEAGADAIYGGAEDLLRRYESSILGDGTAV